LLVLRLRLPMLPLAVEARRRAASWGCFAG